MIRKRFIIIAAIVLVLTASLFAACGPFGPPYVPPPEPGDTVGILITAHGKTVLEFEAGDFESNLVVDILTEHNDKLLIPQAQLDSGFITEIAGIFADWNNGEWWWMFEINGDFSNFGIRQARVQNGDIISFTLTQG